MYAKAPMHITYRRKGSWGGGKRGREKEKSTDHVVVGLMTHVKRVTLALTVGRQKQ